MQNNKPQYTQTKFNQDALDAVYAGAREVAQTVATTLGPMGRNVLLDRGYAVDIVHDGVSVSLVVNPEDPFARAGAKVMQEATQKQRDAVGDGTTAACVLTMAIIDEAKKAIAAGINPMSLRRGLEVGAEKVVTKLESLSTPVTTVEQKIQIATISAEDPELGTLVGETVHRVGNDGVITVDESKALETRVEHQKGMQIDKGYVHEFMETDIERHRAVLEDVYVLVTDLPLNDLSKIGKFLDTQVFPNTKKVLFISPEIGGDFLMALLGAKVKGAFFGVGMRAPGLGTMMVATLLDICALTGATFISKDAGDSFDRMTFQALGHADRIIASKLATIIEGGAGSKEAVKERIAAIKNAMDDDSLSDYDHQQLKGRLGRLTDGVATIKVGGTTEIEMKERKERAEDAVLATQAACHYGLVPGGEVAYLACLGELDESDLGQKILKEALKAPFRQLIENAGMDAGQQLERLRDTVIVPNVEAFGIDVTTGEISNMLEAGIIDPTSVPTTAVTTAVSVATQLASLGAAVVIQNNESA